MARGSAVLLILALCAGGALAKTADTCKKLFGKSGTLIMFADPGSFSGSAESQYIHDNMKSLVEVTKFGWACGSAYTGTLLGQKVTIITTGIGPTTAGLCTLTVLKACGSYIKEAIYLGTSGWSPAVGGVVTPQGSATPNASCAKPGLSVSKGKTTRWKPPQPSDAVYAQNTDYWNATAVGTGGAYYSYAKADKPTVFGPDVCMETDGQFFYSGVPWEITARDYVAEGINLAYNLTGAAAKTALDVVAVSAMEAIGFNEAFERYHASGVKRKIPYTSVRGNSNWLHQPVKLDSAANGVWSYEKIMPDNFAAGYGYAIASYSSLVLQMFSARCTAKKLPSATCAFTINYTGP